MSMDQRNILWYQVSLFGLGEGFSIHASGVSLSFFLTAYSAHAQDWLHVLDVSPCNGPQPSPSSPLVLASGVAAAAGKAEEA